MAEKEQWEELENFDSELIINNDMETEVYYHGSSKTYDYTKNGWARLARENHLSVVSEKIEELDDKYRAVVYVRRYVKIEGIEQVVEIDRVGAHEQKKVEFNKQDPFAFTKALSKAVRNGYKEHMRGHPDITQEKLAALYKAQQGRPPAAAPQQTQKPPQQSAQQKPPEQSAPAPTEQQAGPAQNGNSAEEYTSTKRREMFATFNEVKELLAPLGIDEKVLAEGMHAKFGVESRADMTAEQYMQVTDALRYLAPDGKQFAQWVRDLGKPQTVDGDDVPFSDDEPLLPPPKPELADRVKELMASPIDELRSLANHKIESWVQAGFVSLSGPQIQGAIKNHYGVDMIHKIQLEHEDYANLVALLEKDDLPDFLKQ